MGPYLRGCQTIDKVGRFCLPEKSANENLSSVMQKSADKMVWFFCPTKNRFYSWL